MSKKKCCDCEEILKDRNYICDSCDKKRETQSIFSQEVNLLHDGALVNRK